MLARGDYQGSLACYIEAAKTAVNSNDSTNFFVLQGTIALVNYYMKSYDKAEKYFAETIRFLEKRQDRKELASVYNNLGMVYSAQNRNQEAITNYEKSYRLKLEIGNTDYLHVLNNLGDTWQKMDDLVKEPQ